MIFAHYKCAVAAAYNLSVHALQIHRKCRNLSGHASLVLRPIEALLLLLLQALEGLHNNIKFVIIGCTQQKLWKMTSKVNADRL